MARTMATLLEKDTLQHAYLRRHVEVVEMWNGEWKEIRNESVVKTFLAPASRPRWTMTQQEIIAAVVDGTLFGMVECGRPRPRRTARLLFEMQPVFKNASVTRDDIGPFMRPVCRKTRYSLEARVHACG